MIAPRQPPYPPRRSGVVPVVVLVAVAAVLAGAAVWLFTSAGSTSAEARQVSAEAERTEREARRLTEDTGNRALTDTDATAEVTEQVRTAIEATFSYDHADLDATTRAVDRYLTDEARCQYDAVFEQVRELAPAQRIVMTTGVRDIALSQLTGSDDGAEAEALVFVDQSVTRQGASRSTPAQAQFRLTARLDGDTWQLTSLDFLGQSLVNGDATLTC